MKGITAVLLRFLNQHIREIPVKILLYTFQSPEVLIHRSGALQPFPFLRNACVVVIRSIRFPGKFIKPPFRHLIDVGEKRKTVLNHAFHPPDTRFERFCKSIAVLILQDEPRYIFFNPIVNHLCSHPDFCVTEMVPVHRCPCSISV